MYPSLSCRYTARVITRTSLSCSESALFVGGGVALFVSLPAGVSAEAGGFWAADSSLFFFSCFARSSAFVSLVKAMFFPSGAQTGLPPPLGKSVKVKESPPAIGSIASCGGSGLPFFSVDRRNSRNFPSGDQRGVVSLSPFVSWRGASPPATGSDQMELL